MKLGFYGGTFDPPHNGHKMIMNQCALKFDKLFIFPNNKSPDNNKNNSVPKEHRINMLKLIIEHENILIDDFELKSNQISYTYNTLRYLLDKYKDYKLTMIIGGDQLSKLRSWYQIDYIIKKVNIICFNRSSSKDMEVDNINNLEVINFNFPYSSSYIRKSIKNKITLDDSIIGKSTLTYIHKHKLYI